MKQLSNLSTIGMVRVPGGKFDMGTRRSDLERLSKEIPWEDFSSESPCVSVDVREFYMTPCAITECIWNYVTELKQCFMPLTPVAVSGEYYPVTGVSWREALEFCYRLSSSVGILYSLPTETQWEYACRAGSYANFSMGDYLHSNECNYNPNIAYSFSKGTHHRQKIVPVNSFKPNEFGMYNMHGNVWEWCLDDWTTNYRNHPRNCSVSYHNGSYKVLRGGDYSSSGYACRSAYRSCDHPDSKMFGYGFRVVAIL